MLGRAVVDYLAAGEEGEAVEQTEDGVARLVDGEDDHPLVFSATQAAGGQRSGKVQTSIPSLSCIAYHSLFQQLHNRDSCVCVQASGRLIQEQHLRLYDQLHTNAGPLSLSTRHTAKKLCTHLDGGREGESGCTGTQTSPSRNNS